MSVVFAAMAWMLEYLFTLLPTIIETTAKVPVENGKSEMEIYAEFAFRKIRKYFDGM
jgi:hypothetical protein